MRVHSPTSVGATRRPMSALTRVDLPDLRRPAMATRSGSPSRRRTSRTWLRAGSPRRLPTSWHRSATREPRGPALIASAPPVRPDRWTDERLGSLAVFSQNGPVEVAHGAFLLPGARRDPAVGGPPAHVLLKSDPHRRALRQSHYEYPADAGPHVRASLIGQQIGVPVPAPHGSEALAAPPRPADGTDPQV